MISNCCCCRYFLVFLTFFILKRHSEVESAKFNDLSSSEFCFSHLQKQTIDHTIIV
jgi:hypothetical protein